jgi:hypothetical protein
MIFSSLFLYNFVSQVSTINFIIKYFIKIVVKVHDIFFNMPYVVCYHLAKFELKTPLVHRATKKTNYVKG